MEPKKKKIGIIASVILLLLLVATIVAVVVGVSKAKEAAKNKALPDKKDDGKIANQQKAIEAICQPTAYKETCQSSLEEAAGDSTEPKDLIKAGFQVAANKVSEVAKKSDTLKELAKDPDSNEALAICKELLDYAVDDLLRSVDKMGPFDVSKMDDYLEDLQVWLSAAVNHQETCLDAFKDTKGEAGNKMKEFLKTSRELTSNALAMTTEISSLLGPLNLGSQRKLLAGSQETGAVVIGKRKYQAVPSWLSGRKLDLLTATPQSLKPNVVVAQDGSGKYKTINEALKEVPKNSNTTFVIYVKAGVYKEYVIIDRDMTNVVMIGDGPTKTRITGNKSWASGVKTMQTATFAAVGDYFVAKGIGFENSAGHLGHQAVALRVQSDFSIFYQCDVDAYQDTLYTQTYRQFYRDCTIRGTVDFIFGDGVALFQNCKMLVRKPGDGQSCMVTAQGRTDPNEITAIVLQNCTVSGEADFMPVKDKNKAYLGRPWKDFARVVVMQSMITDAIQPAGWMEWDGETYHERCWIGEYGNRGASSDMSQRVKWKTINKLSAQQVDAFTPAKLFVGDRWIKPSGVPYASGLISV